MSIRSSSRKQKLTPRSLESGLACFIDSSSRPEQGSSSQISNLCSSVPDLGSPISSRRLFDEQSTSFEISCNREDASQYSLTQIKWLMTNDVSRFGRLDFVRCSEHMLRSLFPSKYAGILPFPPPEKRHHAKDVREFMLLGKSERKLNGSIRFYPLDKNQKAKCLGIDKVLCMEHSKKRRGDVSIGYGNLVREALRRRADLLREDELPEYHDEVGVVTNLQKKDAVHFVLKEKTCKDKNDRYTNFYFVSPCCQENIDDEGLISCSSCNSLLPKVKKLCINTLSKVESSKLLKTRNDVVLSSPSRSKAALDSYASVIRKKRNLMDKAKRKHEKMIKERGVTCDFDQELLFPENLEELGEKFFTEKKISQDDLARYLWRESCTHARTARLHGKSHVRIFIHLHSLYLHIALTFFLVSILSRFY